MKKNFLMFSAYFSLLSCNNGEYSFAGNVKSIERGKDGYTAIIKNMAGDSVSATISRVNMGSEYQELEIGDNVAVFGDTTHLGDLISIKATSIAH